MSGESGFVYLAANPHMHGLVKIGRTQNVEKRMMELSACTGVPGEFKAMFSMAVENPANVERQLHGLYSYCRVESRQEFFKVDWQAVRATLLAMNVAYAENEVTVDEPDIETVEPPVDAENQPDQPAETLVMFLQAVQQNNLQEVQRMIEAGEDLNLSERFGWQPFAEVHGNRLIGRLLALNPAVLMAGNCAVVKALIVGIVRQNPGQLWTSKIAYLLGIETAALNGNGSMFFCWSNLEQLQGGGILVSEIIRNKRYWSIA